MSCTVLAIPYALAWIVAGCISTGIEMTRNIKQQKEEEELIFSKRLAVDVLKVPHHGSNSSLSEVFMNSCKFENGIISVGKNNQFGHPNKETIDNLEDSKIYRTDQDGSIMFKIKNNRLKIETCSP